MEKMTNVKALAYVLANAELPTDVKEKVEKMKAQFEKKNSAEKKPTATQIANEGIKGVILETLGNGSLTITEIQKLNSELAELSNQKISALLKQMIAEGSVKREEIKRKAYFSKA
jgi:L-asparaginase/Glu-tRNA(Gln) amidotransferase subunit D